MITCDKCTGECCKYMAIYFEPPHTPDDVEDLKWFVYHGAYTYIDPKGDWYVVIENKCKFVLPSGKCSIYEKRPPMCRNAPVAECHKNLQEIHRSFKTVEEIDAYKKERFPDSK